VRGGRTCTGTCAACHQAEAQGVALAFPPLANCDYLNADKNRAIAALLFGLTGPITVNGQAFNSVMPALGMSDDDVANVLTYVYNHWENAGLDVTPAEVASVRRGGPPAGSAVGVTCSTPALGRDSDPGGRIVHVPAGSHLPLYRHPTKDVEAPGVVRRRQVAAFEMDLHPVTNTEYLTFVHQHPQWRKSAAKTLFVDGAYLAHWSGDLPTVGWNLDFNSALATGESRG